jgi:hypothetical protein
MTMAMTAAEMAYQTGCWFVSSVSEIRIVWNITLGTSHFCLPDADTENTNELSGPKD